MGMGTEALQWRRGPKRWVVILTRTRITNNSDDTATKATSITASKGRHQQRHSKLDGLTYSAAGVDCVRAREREPIESELIRNRLLVVQ